MRISRLSFVLCVAPCLLLPGCAGSTAVTSIDNGLSQAQSVLSSAQAALTGYGIAKGIALMAAAADPAIGSAVNLVIATADPKVATLQALVNAGSADLTQIQSLVAAIDAQAQIITNQSAPAVRVIPAAPAASPAAVPSAWLNPNGRASASQPAYAMD